MRSGAAVLMRVDQMLLASREDSRGNPHTAASIPALYFLFNQYKTRELRAEAILQNNAIKGESLLLVEVNR
jgi:hypothetical protein